MAGKAASDAVEEATSSAAQMVEGREARRERLTRALAGAERGVLLAVVFGVPLIFLPRLTFDAFSVPKLALLVAGVALAASVRLLALAARQGNGLDRMLLLPAGFIVVPLFASWLFSEYKGWSLLGQYSRFEGLIPYVAVVAFGLLLASAFRGDALPVAWALVVSATGVAGYALVQAVGLDPLQVPIQQFVGSTVGHGNFLGGFLAIVLPISVGLWLGDLRGRRWAIACTIVVALGLLLSLSQGGWAAGVAGLSVTGGVLFGRRFRIAPYLGVAVAASVVVVIVGSVILSMASPESSLVGGTTRARGLWWQAAFSMFQDAPVFGHGPNVYAIESPAYRLPIDALSHGNNLSDGPHSVPMAMLANAGLLGALGFVALGLWVIQYGWRGRNRSVLTGSLLGAAVAYFVQALVSFDEVLLAFTLWVVIGMSVASTGGDRAVTQGRSKVGSRWMQGASLIMAAFVAAAGLGWSARFVLADRMVLQGVQAFANDDVAAGKGHFSTALDLRRDPAYLETLGDHLGKAAMDRGPDGGSLLAEMEQRFSYLEDLPFVRGMLTEAYWLHQWSIHDLSKDEDAVGVLSRAVAIDPYNPELRISLAESLLHLGRGEDASTTLREMLPVMRRHPRFSTYHPPVWALLAVIEYHLGREDAARSLLALAVGEGRMSVDCHVLLARQLLERDVPESVGPTLGLYCPPALLELLPEEKRPA